jgi:hypothetical protein
MKRHLALALFLQILCYSVFSPASAYGGWGSGGCGPVGPVVRTVSSGYTWTWHKGCAYLYRNGVQVAGYDPADNVYRTYDAQTGAWSDPQSPPWAPEPVQAPKIARRCGPNCICRDCPCPDGGQCDPGCTCGRNVQQAADGQVEQNFGVDRTKIQPFNRYTINGREVARELAEQAVAGGTDTIPDDSGKLRLTVIGNDAERKAVLDDLTKNAALASVRDLLVVQDYPPTSWAAQGAGFTTTGHPTIYLQKPDGTVLYHRDDYQQGPEGIVSAVRKADPKYDPSKDPNGSAVPLSINWADVEPYLPLGVLGIVLVALRLKRKT